MTRDDSRRWLLLVHQLPSQPSKLRVKIWRRLQSVGAVLVKNSVYVLPNSNETREDFEWIRSEIVNLGGEAMIFTAGAVDDLTTDEVVDAFSAARRSDWDDLRQRATTFEAARQSGLSGEEISRDQIERELKVLRNRVTQIDKIDYFSAPGREEALREIEALAEATRTEPPAADRSSARLEVADFNGRRWLTRPRPGVDRMASAWLIRRFVDHRAEFVFGERIPDRDDLVPFDMFGVEFGHHGEQCTFETLLQSFGLEEPALERIGRIVHDLDLRTESPADSETSTVGRLVAGLRAAVTDDSLLLEHGMMIFEALHRSFRREASGA